MNNERDYQIPEEFRGMDAVRVYQSKEGIYFPEIYREYKENIDRFTSSYPDHQNMGDRHVMDLLDVNLLAFTKVLDYFGKVNPEKKLTSKDIKLEEILGEEETQ